LHSLLVLAIYDVMVRTMVDSVVNGGVVELCF